MSRDGAPPVVVAIAVSRRCHALASRYSAARAELTGHGEREARDIMHLEGESKTHGRIGRLRTGNGTESTPTHTQSKP